MIERETERETKCDKDKVRQTNRVRHRVRQSKTECDTGQDAKCGTVRQREVQQNTDRECDTKIVSVKHREK